jgi:cytochrome c
MLQRSSFAPMFLGLLAIHSTWITTYSYAEEVDMDRFERTVLTTGLIQPMEMAIAPDGSIFLIELAGIVKKIDPQTGQASVIGKLNVTTAQENGLIGLALDPNFAENNWVYLQYSPPDFSGQRVSRFLFKDNQIDLESEQRLFSYEEQRRECCHHAGSMEFGPDGNLYIGTGDNTNPFNDSQGFAPLDERENREPWDAQRTAGNTKSYNGKILRIRPEADGTYSIPDGNLFPKDGSIGHPEIYVMGCRNPWRLNIDQRTGILYWGDVGPDAGGDAERGPRGYDEVNQARTAGNYGWPYFIGNNRAYSMVNFATNEIGPPQDPNYPVNRSVNNTGAKELPPARPAMIYYPAGESAEFPAVGSGGRTACAGPVYYYNEGLRAENKFPAAYDSTLFAFEWSRNWILAVHLDADSNIKSMERFLPKLNFVRPIDLQFDAQGSLYVVEYGETWGVNADARLVRIDYVRGNRAPIAAASAENNIGREPLVVKLSAAGSIDKDADALSYQWKATRNGTQSQTQEIVATTAEAEVTFKEPGVYTVELEVRDPSNSRSVMSLPVIVGNAPPTVEFRTPQTGDFFDIETPIQYQLVVRDFEDGTSDFEEAEELDVQPIEATAPNRVFAEAVAVSLGANANSTANDPPGLALIRKSDCFNCHAVNRPLVGPSFVDIANKYRDQSHQLELSITRVMQGSTGVWGKVAMLPHAQHTPEQVRQMVEYVFSVKADSSNPNARGFRNALELKSTSDAVRIDATYTDLGRGDIPAQSAVASVLLRSRRVQAEAADEFQGTKPLGSDRAEGKKFMGAIEHDGYLRFNHIALHQVSKIEVKVASAGAGGVIEIRRDHVDGPLLGSTTVEVNGEWEKFYEKSIDLAQSEDRADIFLVFKNPKNRGGLMNIDAVEFKK